VKVRIRPCIVLPALGALLAAACAQPEPEQDTPSTTAAAPPVAGPAAPPPAEIDWAAVDSETVRHFQALLRLDTRDPPGNELPAADYLMGVLQRAGIEARTFALEPNRPNVVARIRGNGSRPPLLIMAHTDVVNIDTTKWRFPPFSATRDSGYIYGRGAVDDKDNLAANLMLMLLLRRQQVPLARDVIPRIQALMSLFREKRLPVVFTEFTYSPAAPLLVGELHPEHRRAAPGAPTGFGRPSSSCLEGHASADTVPDLAPAPGELVVRKHGYDAFHGSVLDGALRARGVTSLLVAGTITDVCVLATVTGAFHRQYGVAVVEDAVATLWPEAQRAALDLVARAYGRVVPAGVALGELLARA